MNKVLITTSSFGKLDSSPLDLLLEFSEVISNPYGRKITTEEFIELSKDADAVIAGVEQITREALLARPNIKVISRCGVGMDSIDTQACNDLGVKLYNTPYAPVESVAELTVTVILSMLKNIIPMNNDLKSGKWNKMTAYMLSGKKLGIIGLGRIGYQVATLIEQFGTEVSYFDIEKKDCKYNYMEKSELLKWADIISVHTSMCNDGDYIIGKSELDIMNKSSYLVNTSRGRYIDEQALYDALVAGKISGAALDVFSEEPYLGKLCELDNVIVTPHISSSAKEGRVKMEMESVINVLDGLGIRYD